MDHSFGSQLFHRTLGGMGGTGMPRSAFSISVTAAAELIAGRAAASHADVWRCCGLR